MAQQVVRKRTYIWVWVALMCLTGLTGGISFINLHSWSAPIAFAIAVLKALLVATFFMHLLYEKQKIVWVWSAVGIVWLTIMIVLTMDDYVTRGFLRVAGK
jgi:cytochrome c oxidase subunit IV